MQVKVLYDFDGEPNSSELTIRAGEFLTVTNRDIGEGWWEGYNSAGQKGLFPEAYVEEFKKVEPPLPPPPSVLPAAPTQAAHVPVNYDVVGEDYDSDWDENDDDWGNTQFQSTVQRQSQVVTSPQDYSNAILPQTPDDTTSIASSNFYAPQKKGSKIFSKNHDNFIMAITSVDVSEAEKVFIFPSDHGYFWKPIDSPYTVIVDSPKKETKLKGLKSFIAYQLTPSFNNEPVSRRYKHFDWLHERLVEKFCMIPIPPLPDKQISGRYEEHFIEHRRIQLQEFVDWVCRHPVLATCEVWMHFLTCKDEKKWKVGKRAAEKDPLTGIAFVAAVFPPDKQLLQSNVEAQTDICKNFVHSMDSAVKTLENVASEQCNKYVVVQRKDFQRIGDGLCDLAKALEIDERRAVTNICLSNSVAHAAGVYIKIGKMFEEQVKRDWQPFCDHMHIYRGILGSFPDILNEHRNVMGKKKECEKLTAEQKMGNAQLQEVNRRVDVFNYALMAEMSHFRAERDVHLKQTMRDLISEQIEFYARIIDKLQEAKKFFD